MSLSETTPAAEAARPEARSPERRRQAPDVVYSVGAILLILAL